MIETIAVNDRGLAYGDGLFETIAYVNDELHNWQRHWQRLQMGAERLALDLPEETFVIKQINQKIIQNGTSSITGSKTAQENKVVKIIITRGQGGRGYLYPEQKNPRLIISIHDWPERAIDDYQEGIHVTVCHTRLAKQPALAGIKHLNRLEQVLARNEFSNSRYQEGIMLQYSDGDSDMDSLIIEGTSSNLFFVINGCLSTPLIDSSGVQGTMKQAVLSLAKQKVIIIDENYVKLSQLKDASEVFFTNSIFGIIPVASITPGDGQEWCYSKNESSITSQLANIINKNLNRPY